MGPQKPSRKATTKPRKASVRPAPRKPNPVESKRAVAAPAPLPRMPPPPPTGAPTSPLRAWMPAQVPSAPPTPLRPLQGLLKAMTWLIGIVLVFSVISIASQWADGGGDLSTRSKVLSFLGFGPIVSLIVVFCIWFHRVLANARDRHPEVAISPGWGVGSFFIPFVFLVAPGLEAAKAWRADTGQTAGPIAAWFVPWSLSQAMGFVVAIVMVVLTFGAVLDAVGERDADVRQERLEEAQGDARVLSRIPQAIAQVLYISSGIFLILLARRWTAHQEGTPAV